MLVSVKWGTQRFDGLSLDPAAPPLAFKQQLASLTGIAAPKQQLMIKGSLVKDGQSPKLSSPPLLASPRSFPTELLCGCRR